MVTITVCVHGEIYELVIGPATSDRLFRLARKRGESCASLASRILERLNPHKGE